MEHEAQQTSKHLAATLTDANSHQSRRKVMICQVA